MLFGIFGNGLTEKKKKTQTNPFMVQQYYVSNFILYRLFFIECILSIQQILMSLPGCVITAVLVASSVCGEEDEVLKAKLLATTIFLSGITTFLQVTFGVR